jgi:hypothetical protein
MRTAPPPTSITSVMPGALRRLLFVNFSCMGLGATLSSNPTPPHPRKGWTGRHPQTPGRLSPCTRLFQTPARLPESWGLGAPQRPWAGLSPCTDYLQTPAQLPKVRTWTPDPWHGCPTAPRRSLLDRQATEGWNWGRSRPLGVLPPLHPTVSARPPGNPEISSFSGSASAKAAILGCAQ